MVLFRRVNSQLKCVFENFQILKKLVVRFESIVIMAYVRVHVRHVSPPDV
jgi:hypothetical protein